MPAAARDRTLAAVAAALIAIPAQVTPAAAAGDDARLGPMAAAGSSGTPAAFAYRLFATREGLVGRTTANGHVITERDHFVALPSRRALAGKGAGDHSVRVCTASRCAYEPVWDVGPWNTKDDYWAEDRESWTDLPQGKPEAQAAYEDGYHGGKDQFGRKVRNPAGIDLADGTIWDGLRLSGNAWVTVSFLWTGGGTQGRVSTAGGTLQVRSGPGTDYPVVGLAGPYARVPVECQADGTLIDGHVGTTRLWDRIGPDNYVSHAYVVLDSGVTPVSC